MPDCICSTPSIGTARLMFKGVEVLEHSQIVRETIGTADGDTLMCESDYSPCCTDTENGWFFDFGTPIFVNSGGWYQERDDGVVRLHYNGGTAEGIFYCQIRVSAAAGALGLQLLYVGIYPSEEDSTPGGDGKPV